MKKLNRVINMRSAIDATNKGIDLNKDASRLGWIFQTWIIQQLIVMKRSGESMGAINLGAGQIRRSG